MYEEVQLLHVEPAAKKAKKAGESVSAASINPTLNLDYRLQQAFIDKKGSNKGLTLAAMLQHLHSERAFNQVKGKLNESITNIPGVYNEKSYVKMSLELVEFVISEVDRQLLTAKVGVVDSQTIYTLCCRLQRQCMDQLWVFEGSDPEVERELINNGAAGNKKKGTYQAIGVRVREYKDKIMEGLVANGKPVPKRASALPLCKPEEILKTPLENGQTTINQHFKPIEKN